MYQFVSIEFSVQFFLYKTMDSDVYMKISQDFITLLEEVERESLTAHMAEKMMDVSAKFFEDRIISKGRWLTRSPDLQTFFVGIFKK